ncbi:MAG TPA: hypothetical protein VIP11_17365, partial [Gemmatimonadaceae bacterium]
SLGVVRPYPKTLMEEPNLQPILASGESAPTGATELARSLYTLPSHRFVGTSDLVELRRWLSSD